MGARCYDKYDKMCVRTYSVFMLRKHEHNKKVPIGFYCFRLVHYNITYRHKKYP